MSTDGTARIFNVRSRVPAVHRRRPRGLGLIEILVSVAIAAALLVAVAAAWSASADGVEHNEQHFRAAQTARVTMTQVLAEVRRCAAIHSDTFRDGLTTTNLRLLTAVVETPTGVRPGRDLEWRFVPAATAFTNPFTGTASTLTYGRLMMIDRSQNKVFTIARDVDAVEFVAQLGANNAGLPNVPVAVTVKLTTRLGDNQLVTTGSAAPRYNMVY